MKNAIGIFSETTEAITSFIQWLRSSIRYTLMYTGSTIGPVSDESVDTIMADIIAQVEHERHQVKVAEGTLDTVNDQDIQALVYAVLAFSHSRSVAVRPMEVNGILEGLANGITASCWEQPGRIGELSATLPMAELRRFCPPLAQIVEAKVHVRREAQTKDRDRRMKVMDLTHEAGKLPEPPVT